MDSKEKEIIEQVAEIFNRYGIKSITMDELARQIGISKKTLYQYFTDKNELVEKTLNAIMAQNQCLMNNIDKSLNAIEEMMEVYRFVNEMIRSHNPVLEFDLQRYFPQLFKKMRESHRLHTYNMLLENLKKGKAEDFYRLDIDNEILAKLSLLRIEYFMHSDLITAEEIHSNKFFTEVFKYHLFGIISKKGWQYIQTNHPEFITSESK